MKSTGGGKYVNVTSIVVGFATIKEKGFIGAS